MIILHTSIVGTDYHRTVSRAKKKPGRTALVLPGFFFARYAMLLADHRHIDEAIREQFALRGVRRRIAGLVGSRDDHEDILAWPGRVDLCFELAGGCIERQRNLVPS